MSKELSQSGDRRSRLWMALWNVLMVLVVVLVPWIGLWAIGIAICSWAGMSDQTAYVAGLWPILAWCVAIGLLLRYEP